MEGLLKNALRLACQDCHLDADSLTPEQLASIRAEAGEVIIAPASALHYKAITERLATVAQPQEARELLEELKFFAEQISEGAVRRYLLKTTSA